MRRPLALALLALLALLAASATASARTTKVDLQGSRSGNYLTRGDRIFVLAYNFLPRRTCKRKVKFTLTDSDGRKFRLASRRPRHNQFATGAIHGDIGKVPSNAAHGRATLRSKQKCGAARIGGRERFRIILGGLPTLSNAGASDALSGDVATARFHLSDTGRVRATVEYELLPGDWREIDLAAAEEWNSQYGAFFAQAGDYELRWRADADGPVPAGHYRFALVPSAPRGFPEGPTAYVDFYVAEAVGQGRLDRPVDAQLDLAGRLVVADGGDNELEVFSITGAHEATYAPGLTEPKDVAFGPDLSVFVADSGNYRIFKFRPGESSFTTFGSRGTGDGQFSPSQGPQGLAATAANGGRVYTVDGDLARIQVWNLNGAFQSKITGGGLDDPISVSTAGDGSIWVSDPGAPEKLLHFSAGGQLLGQIALADSFGIDVDRSGRVIASHPGAASVFDAAGNRIARPVGDGLFTRTGGVAAAGLAGDFYVVDGQANRVLRFRVP